MVSTPCRTSVLKPDNSALNSYRPTGSNAKTYLPSDPVTDERASPVSRFLAVTITPGRTASRASVTRPVTVLVVWAEAGPAMAPMQSSAAAKARNSERNG